MAYRMFFLGRKFCPDVFLCTLKPKKPLKTYKP